MTVKTIKQRVDIQTQEEHVDNEKATRVVLAEGLASGHAHAFYGKNTVSLKGSTLIVQETDLLLHEEHAAHVLEPGIGDVTIQREYEMGAVRRVAD